MDVPSPSRSAGSKGHDISRLTMPEVKEQRIRSHSGCQRCKRRRQKCDERKPSCGRCDGAGSPCSYAITLKWEGRAGQIQHRTVAKRQVDGSGGHILEPNGVHLLTCRKRAEEYGFVEDHFTHPGDTMDRFLRNTSAGYGDTICSANRESLAGSRVGDHGVVACEAANYKTESRIRIVGSHHAALLVGSDCWQRNRRPVLASIDQQIITASFCA